MSVARHTSPVDWQSFVESADATNPADLEARASALDSAGYAKTAREFRRRAAVLRAVPLAARKLAGSRDPRPSVVEGEAAAPASSPGPSITEARAALSSPFPQHAGDPEWRRFVAMMQRHDYKHVSPTSGALGAFAMPVRRLQDLGLVTRSTRDRGAWRADAWREPLSGDAFLDDPLVQHRTFRASCRNLAPSCLPIVGRGAAIDGATPTLSGVLAVAHHAGPNLARWIESADDRRRHGVTTAAFEAANGVF